MSQFLFLGDHPCLDFVNTKLIRRGKPADLLTSFPDLASWAAEAGILTRSETDEAIRRWSRAPEGDKTFREAIRFRKSLRDMVEKIADHKKVPAETIRSINRFLSRSKRYEEVLSSRGRFQLGTRRKLDHPVQLLSAIAETAAHLLCFTQLRLIARCENPKCVLYFYDETKNHTRRWCSMSGCGNRMKVAAYYRRHKSGSA